MFSSENTSRSASTPRNGTHTRLNTRLLPVADETSSPNSFRLTVSRRAFPRFLQEPQTRLMPPPCRTPPGQKPGHPPGPAPTAPLMAVVSMPLLHLTTRQQRFGVTHLPGPHLTPPRMPFPHRSPRRSSANAACGGLKPPPDRRLRRAKTFISCRTPIPESLTYLHQDLQSSFVAH